jgi:hypothetical protein
LKNEKQKVFFVLLSWFCGTPYTGTGAQASTSWLKTLGWLELANGDRFCSVSVYGVPLSHESKTEDFFSFNFESVIRANLVNMKSLLMVVSFQLTDCPAPWYRVFIEKL